MVNLKPFLALFRQAGLVLVLAALCSLEAEAQLLEDGQGRLKTIKGESRGFLFFQRRIKSEDPNDFRRGKKKTVKVKYSQTTPYSPKQLGKSPRYSVPPFSSKDKRVDVRYSVPPFSSKDKQVDVRYSKPQKETFYNFWITQQQRNKRRKAPVPSTEGLYGKAAFSFLPTFNLLSKDRNYDHTKDVGGLYVKSRFWFQRPWVYRNKLSITGSMSFESDEKIREKLREQFRPINTFTLNYQGDLKRRIPFLENLYKRIGQWQQSSYKGHHTGWSKFGRKAYFKGTSGLIANHQGRLKTLRPFFADINEKVKNWEQSRYQGRSTGWSKLGRTAYLKGSSNLMANYEGDYKVKRRKGGDMHPSIAYISGKRFANSTWKERWRKLNIFWVRLNPGKEVSQGSKEKINVKYDKEERDIWTY